MSQRINLSTNHYLFYLGRAVDRLGQLWSVLTGFSFVLFG